MKKLMVVAALAMAAVSVNAAQIKWQLSGTYSNKITDNGTVWTKVTGASAFTAYFLVAANQDTVEAALKSTTTPFTGQGTIQTYAGAFNTYGGMTAANAQLADNAAVTVASQAYKLLLTYKDSEGVVHYQFTSPVSAPGTLDYDSTPADIGFNYQNVSDTGWQTVPEPTSGLLLLLGVAGLALRRRRA